MGTANVSIFPNSRVLRNRYGLALCGVIILYCFLGFSYYLGAGSDDAFISLWVGERLAAGDGIVNQNFEQVEVCSSLLHTLILAVLATIAPSYVFTLNKMAGLACGVVVLVSIYWYREDLYAKLKRCRFAACATTLILVGTNPSFLYWNLGSQETPFVTLLLVLYTIGLAAHWRRPSLRLAAGVAMSAGLYTLVRPEGFYIVLFGIIYAILFVRIHGWQRPVCAIVGVPALFFVLVTGWRLVYFNALFPNPVYAKMGSMVEGVKNGLIYCWYFCASSLFIVYSLVIVAILAFWYGQKLWFLASKKRAVSGDHLDQLFTFGMAVTVILVVVLAGGDWMTYFRLFVPAFPLLAILSTVFTFAFFEAINEKVEAIGARRVLWAVQGLFVALLVILNATQDDLNIPRPLPWRVESSTSVYSVREVFSSLNELDRRMMLLNKEHARDILLTEPFLEQVFPGLYAQHGRIVIAGGQMGVWPYIIRKHFPDHDITFVDHLGLCDYAIARLPLAKDCIGLTQGKFVDEVLSGAIPLLSDHVRARKPHLAYMLGYAADMDRRVQVLENEGYHLVYENWPQLVFFNPFPP